MQERIHLTPRENVWLATYTPTNNDEADGLICLEKGKVYTLPVLVRFLNVTNYTIDELVIKTEDVALAVQAGKIEVTLDEETQIVRGYN